MEKPQEEKQPLTTKQTVTMTELLEKELALEEEAAAQQSQNWGDENRCNFSDGYKNQPVYSCETCSKDNDKMQFGFCYGCSMNCHLDHVVHELFEKRHFRCDCGTPKSGCVCSFANSKDDKSNDNTENVYSHNFDGLYCYCDGIYDSANMIMYQCIMCLDWFHIECIKSKEPDAFVPSEDVPSDFLCCQCVENNPFLFSYSHLLLMGESKPENKKEETVDVTSEECKLKNSSQTRPSKPQKTFFFEDGWKNELCRCQSCLELYKKHNVEYLLEPDVAEEEEETSGETISMLEYSQNAFLRSDIPHTSKVDIIQGYNSFVSNLKEYLKDFATSGKEVTKEDIQHFSEELQKKRRKLG